MKIKDIIKIIIALWIIKKFVLGDALFEKGKEKLTSKIEDLFT